MTKYLVEYTEKHFFFKPEKKYLILNNQEELEHLHYQVMGYNFGLFRKVKIISIYKLGKKIN